MRRFCVVPGSPSADKRDARAKLVELASISTQQSPQMVDHVVVLTKDFDGYGNYAIIDKTSPERP